MCSNPLRRARASVPCVTRDASRRRGGGSSFGGGRSKKKGLLPWVPEPSKNSRLRQVLRTKKWPSPWPSVGGSARPSIPSNPPSVVPAQLPLRRGLTRQGLLWEPPPPLLPPPASPSFQEVGCLINIVDAMGGEARGYSPHRAREVPPFRPFYYIEWRPLRRSRRGAGKPFGEEKCLAGGPLLYRLRQVLRTKKCCSPSEGTPWSPLTPSVGTTLRRGSPLFTPPPASPPPRHLSVNRGEMPHRRCR